MDLFYLLVLGITQAITEFVPVSSSGHLILIDELTAIESSLVIDVALHAGTLIALIIYYRKTLIGMIKQLFNSGKSHLLWMLVVASIPAGIIGFTFEETLEEIRIAPVVVVMLMLVGINMVCEKWFFPKVAKLRIAKLKWYHALWVGVAQAVSLIPGTSRSAVTIIAGRWVGLSNKRSADFAFLIGIPAIAGATLKVLLGADARDVISAYPLDVLFGVVVAAVVGLFAIKFVLKFVKDNGLMWFGVYRLALAVGILFII